MRFWVRVGLALFLEGGIASAAAGNGSLVNEDPAATPALTAPPRATLSLAQAMALIQGKNLDLPVAAQEAQALSARVLQAGLRPNPEISAEVENIAGSGAMGWGHSAETTIQLTIPLESAAKRRARVQVALDLKELAEKEAQTLRAELTAAGLQAFAEAMACLERLQNRNELYLLTEQIDQTVSGRVTAGRISPIEASRSRIELQSAKLEKEKAIRAWNAAKDRLASYWNGRGAEFDTLQGTFQLPPRALWETWTGKRPLRNPQLEQADRQIQAGKNSLSYEITSRKPDLSLSAGYRRLNPLGESALVAGISIPLALFDRRQGSIEEARRRIDKARLERMAVESRLQAHLTQQRHAAETAFLEAGALAESILPAARQTLAQVEEGFRQGKFDFMSVLDAQHTYAALKGRYLEAVAVAVQSVIALLQGNGDLSDPNLWNQLFSPN